MLAAIFAGDNWALPWSLPASLSRHHYLLQDQSTRRHGPHHLLAPFCCVRSVISEAWPLWR